MSQVTDRTVGANPTGFDMRTELNNIIGALETCNSGTSEPLNAVQFMYWFDTSNATYYYLKQRNHDNTAWNSLYRYTVATKAIHAMSNGVVLDDTTVVHKTGDETKAGVLTFTSTPAAPQLKLGGISSNYGKILIYDSTNSSIGEIGSTSFTGDGTILGIGTVGLGTSLVFGTNSTERLRIDTSGNVLVTGSGGLGYGTGSGGAVTQLTSKSTSVTLNKHCGQIIMNNAALAAGASVGFYLNNSLLTYDSLVIVNPIANNNYTAQVFNTSADSVGIRVTNTTAGSLSEVVVLNFAIIKVTTS